MHRAYLSLGSNLGNREQHLAEALRLLNESGVLVERASSLYETEPQDVSDQPWFLNQCVCASTDLSPHNLLHRTSKIEVQLGRNRTAEAVRSGPRIIDIDVLLYEQVIIDSPDLTIPHPRMMQRRFVLIPLLEITSAEFRHPVTGTLLRDEMTKISDQSVRVYTPPHTDKHA